MTLGRKCAACGHKMLAHVEDVSTGVDEQGCYGTFDQGMYLHDCTCKVVVYPTAAKVRLGGLAMIAAGLLLLMMIWVG